MSKSKTQPFPLKHWCKNLRWKSYDADRTQPDRLRVLLDEGGELCTCLHTAQEVGHDDESVAMDACGPARTCYEAHPSLAPPSGTEPLV